VEIPLRVQVSTSPMSWESSYSTSSNRDYTATLVVTHFPDRPSAYKVANINRPPTDTNEFIPLTGDEILAPFARSDFAIADLGLEFFWWPQQKVLKKEVHRSCGCTVLESTNPSTNGYSRIVSWIDTESLGIVEAYAYDARGKQLKDFYPKDLKKVNGQYQVQTMVMENTQTGTRTRLEFEAK
jgi:hypothetical protein